MSVLETPNRPDFEILARALAHRCEPVTLTGGCTPRRSLV
jgi:hypothetical protein